ncbi:MULTISPECIES: YitT family protein [Bacillus]|uniref:YitT family protein n=1 Tax=Bacillus salipaludis TaxID=2547811 RepID=A0A4R5VL84_9BACI|nr:MULTISPECIES: YitT family protein [Bacillus]MDQ6599151.1 YitT family protein [Bacillus salipaludis]MED1467750.1 YitT family protein [Bacillus salipaludis]TDK58798.1 YitT family protein [Bacillus salipaludis]WHY89994.1 YitT family protein [Neobacillus cucumis]
MQYLGIVFGSLIVAFGFNLFLIPHQVLSGGMSGISMILGMITPLNTGFANFLLNLPLLIIGYKMLGRRLIINSILSVIIISIGLYIIPVHAIAQDKILSSIFGGAITGLGVGMVFRSSGSTGGFDIISMILARKMDFPIGALLSGMNGVVIIISGFLFNWDSALNTLVSIFVTGKVVDAIYTDHAKLTIMIITEKGEEMRKHLLSNLYRGLTIMDGVGGYSNNKRNILVTVISRYELNDVKNLISEVDTSAFVNITETIEVMGLFHRPSPN